MKQRLKCSVRMGEEHKDDLNKNKQRNKQSSSLTKEYSQSLNTHNFPSLPGSLEW